MSCISVYKPPGKTPLEMIRLLKKNNPQYRDVKIAYAGRLDPMAEGVLLLLTGDDCKNRTLYERMDKTYRATILLGIETDTYDILGLPTLSPHRESVSDERLHVILQDIVGTFEQAYPPYSSARVDGHPLFYWARKNRLSEISIPQKTVTITTLTVTDRSSITFRDLYHHLSSRIKLVTGDFRQADILHSWKNLSAAQNAPFQTISIAIQCSSGTYIRSVTHNIGELLGTKALLLHLVRERVGNYASEKALRLTE